MCLVTLQELTHPSLAFPLLLATTYHRLFPELQPGELQAHRTACALDYGLSEKCGLLELGDIISWRIQGVIFFKFVFQCFQISKDFLHHPLLQVNMTKTSVTAKEI